MTDLMIIDIGKRALLLLFYMGGPMLMAALVIGLLVSLFQAATQLNEMTMTFIPKVVGVGAILLYMMPTMGQMFKDFFVTMMALIPQINP